MYTKLSDGNAMSMSDILKLPYPMYMNFLITMIKDKEQEVKRHKEFEIKQRNKAMNLRRNRK